MIEHVAAREWLDRVPLAIDLPSLVDRRVMVTGSEGFIGSRVCALVERLGGEACTYDSLTSGGWPRWRVDDILDLARLRRRAERAKVDAIVHLAAHKYATTGEDMPAEVAEVNVRGTANVRAVAHDLGADLVTASTCKAVDPCTAYGASKLLAEREALRYERARVLRLVNVLGSTGSVIDIWSRVPDGEPLPLVSDARRMWMTPNEATAALLALLAMPSGVYAPRVPPPESILRLAARVHPKRASVYIPLRRGDRPVERLVGEYETADAVTGALMRVRGPWG